MKREVLRGLSVAAPVFTACALGVAFLCLCYNTWGIAPKWNGQVYQNVLEQFIAGGGSTQAVDPQKFPATAGVQLKQGFLQACYFWILHSALWVLLFGGKATGGVLLAHFALGAVFFGTVFYFYLRRAWKLSPHVSGVGTALALGLMPLTIIFRVRAHPEAWSLLLTTLMIWAGMERRPRAFGICFLLGYLTKQSILPACAVFLAGLWLSAPASREAAKSVRALTWAAAVGVGVHALIQYQIAWPEAWQTKGIFLKDWYLQGIHYMAFARSGDYFLRNFDLLWILFFAGAVASPRGSAERVWSIASIAVCVPLLAISTDWFRNLYASLYWLVIPLGLRFYEQEVGPRATRLQAATLLLIVVLFSQRLFDTLRLLSMGDGFVAFVVLLLVLLMRPKAAASAS